MKKLILLIVLICFWMISCQRDEKIVLEKEIKFSIAKVLQIITDHDGSKGSFCGPKRIHCKTYLVGRG